jgi:Flp pilus assembly protein TadG
MALVLPLLLLIVFGIIDFGRMLNAQITVTEAAREAARAEALGGNPAARANTVAQALGPVSVAVQSACPTPVDFNRDAVVSITYSFTFVTPVGSLGALFGGGGGASGTVALSGRGVMPCQQ